jgi:hypothetical protein
MGRIRHWLRRLERESKGGLIRIPQAAGTTTFTIERMEAHKQTFLYLYESMMADADAVPRPAPPPVLVAVAGTKDRLSALEKVLDGYSNLPVDPSALVEDH